MRGGGRKSSGEHCEAFVICVQQFTAIDFVVVEDLSAGDPDIDDLLMDDMNESDVALLAIEPISQFAALQNFTRTRGGGM